MTNAAVPMVRVVRRLAEGLKSAIAARCRRGFALRRVRAPRNTIRSWTKCSFLDVADLYQVTEAEAASWNRGFMGERHRISRRGGRERMMQPSSVFTAGPMCVAFRHERGSAATLAGRHDRRTLE